MPNRSDIAETQAKLGSSTMKATTWQGKQSISVVDKPKPVITEDVRYGSGMCGWSMHCVLAILSLHLAAAVVSICLEHSALLLLQTDVILRVTGTAICG